MNGLSTALDFLKVPNPFRDVLVTFGGFAFLLLLNHVTDYGLLMQIFNNAPGRVEGDIAIAIISFLSGKMLIILSDAAFALWLIFLEVVIFLFLREVPLRSRLPVFFQSLKRDWRKQLREILRPTITPVSPNTVKNEVTAVDYAAITQKYPGLSADIERDVYYQILIKLILASSLIVGIFYIEYYLILSGISLALLQMTMLWLKDKQEQIYRGVVRERDIKD